MPIIKSAGKKLRQDKFRTQRNKTMLRIMKDAIKEARTKTSPKALQAAFSALDTAVKKNVIHDNRAGRLKSSITRLVIKPKAQKSAT